MAVKEERLEAAAKNSAGKKSRRRVRLLRARSSAKLREVTSGSATQGLWLRNRKMGSQISTRDQSGLPGKRTVREIRRGGKPGRRTSDRAKK